MLSRLYALSLLGLCAGCAGSFHDNPDLLVFVPGAGGNGAWYDGLRQGLKDGGVAITSSTFKWGCPRHCT